MSQPSHRKITEFQHGYILEIQILAAKLIGQKQDDCDPYAVCKIKDIKYRTETCKKTLTPQWNRSPLKINIDQDTKLIEVSVNKHGIVGKRIIIGTAEILLSKLGNDVYTTAWYTLTLDKKKTGSVQCRFRRLKEAASEEPQSIDNGWTDLSKSIQQKMDNYEDSSIKFYEEIHREETQSSVDKTVKHPKQPNEDKTEKKRSVVGPLHGFLKIEIDEIDDYNTNIGYKGHIVNQLPNDLDVDKNIWNNIFPLGMVVKDIKQQCELKPFIVYNKHELLYFYFIIDHIPFTKDNTTLYIPFAVGLMSKYPIFEVMRRLLLAMFIQSPKLNDTINSDSYERHIKSLYELMCVENIVNGHTNQYKVFDLTIEIRMPIKHSLPILSSPIYSLFNVLSINDIIQVIHCIMFKYTIVIYSYNDSLLVFTIDNILSLLHPLNIPHKIQPILPYSQLSQLSKEYPILVGIPSFYKNSSHNQLSELSKTNILEVDLDSSTIRSLHSPIPLIQLDAMTELQQELIQAYKEKYFALDTIGNDIYDDRYFIPNTHTFNVKIQVAFTKYMTKLLSGLNKFINYIWITDKSIPYFNKDAFLLTKTKSEQDILQVLIDSNSLHSFIHQITKTPLNVYSEWIEYNIFNSDYIQLVTLYSKQRPFVNISPTTVQIPSYSNALYSFKPTWSNLFELRLSETAIRLSKIIPKPKSYTLQLSHLTQPETISNMNEIEMFNNFFTTLKNVTEDISLETEDIYKCVSVQKSRNTFVTCMISNVTTKNCCELHISAYNILQQLVLSIMTYCRSDKDIITPTLIVTASNMYYYKIDSITDHFLIQDIGNNHLWENQKIWFTFFSEEMVKSKRSVYGDLYNISLPNTWKKLSTEKKTFYHEKEINGLVAVIHSLSKNMKTLLVKNSIVFDVIHYCLDYVNAPPDAREIIFKLLSVVTEKGAF